MAGDAHTTRRSRPLSRSMLSVTQRQRSADNARDTWDRTSTMKHHASRAPAQETSAVPQALVSPRVSCDPLSCLLTEGHLTLEFRCIVYIRRWRCIAADSNQNQPEPDNTILNTGPDPTALRAAHTDSTLIHTIQPPELHAVSRPTNKPTSNDSHVHWTAPAPQGTGEARTTAHMRTHLVAHLSRSALRS